MENANTKKYVLISVIISYLLLVISTFLGKELLMEIFSPAVCMLSFTLLYLCIYDIPEFGAQILTLGLGILCWGIGDIIRLLSHIALNIDPLNTFVRTMYVFPNYFFGVALFLYVRRKLNKRNIYRMLADAFVLAIIGFVILRKLLTILSANTSIPFASYVRTMLYFFVNSVIVILVIHLVRMVKGLNMTNPLAMVPFSILGFIILDFQYTYKEALGQEAENVYFDLIYILFMILMCIGVYWQVDHAHNFEVRAYEYTKAEKYLLRFQIVFIVLMDIVLYLIRFLSSNEFFYILIAVLAYWIMSTTFEKALLDETLLKHQQDLNRKLEEQVEQKTLDLKIANENLEKLSSTDMLTGLYNRRYSNIFINKLVEDYTKSEQRFAVFCIDLNHFKPINDTYGHDMGDRVLAEFGHRMLRLPKNQIAFRTGGDEFMIVQCDLINRNEVLDAAQKLQKLLNTPIALDTYSFNLSGSVGIALYPNDSNDPDLIQQYADAAMYTVKRSGNKDGFRFFDKGLIAMVEKRKQLELIMEKSVPEKDFFLHYQPIMNLERGRIIGAEVFPRLKTATDFDYNAADIISIAEENGLMGELGKWIISEALRQVLKWNKKYDLDLISSLNLSALQLLDASFISHLKNEVNSTGYHINRLGLDISTNVMLNTEDSSKEALKDLHDFGFALCLNDFGGGELSLSNFLDCHFSVIKISHSLVEKAAGNDDALLLIKSIKAMADTMGMRTCAVGVESTEQADELKTIGIHHAQGYLYGKPCSAEEFEATFLA